MSDLEKLTNTTTEITKTNLRVSGGGGYDWKILEDGTNSTEFWETGRSVVNDIKENFALKKITKNLWRSIKYYEDYNSHLLGLTTKEVFNEQIKSHATQYDRTSEEELLFITGVCVNIIESNLTSSELSQMTNSAPEQIDTVLLKNPLFINLSEG